MNLKSQSHEQSITKKSKEGIRVPCYRCLSIWRLYLPGIHGNEPLKVASSLPTYFRVDLIPFLPMAL